MVNMYNKVRTNLTKLGRRQNQLRKISGKRTSKSLLTSTNKSILAAIDLCNQAVEEQAETLGDSVDEGAMITAESAGAPVVLDVRKLEKKVQVVKAGRMGKNNSVIKPKLLSKKKIRQLRTASKVAVQRIAEKSGSGAMEIDETSSMLLDEPAIPSPPAKKQTKAAVESMVIAPSGKGTILGGPR